MRDKLSVAKCFCVICKSPHAFHAHFSFVIAGREAEAVGQSLAGQCFELRAPYYYVVQEVLWSSQDFPSDKQPFLTISRQDHKVLVFVSQKQYADELAHKLCEARPLMNTECKTSIYEII